MPHLDLHKEQLRGVDSSDPLAAVDVADALADLLGDTEGEVVLFCIGSDRATGDCLGPMVGTILSQAPFLDATVIGTLDKPIQAANITEAIRRIEIDHPGARIIALDAMLGNLDSVGRIFISKGSLKPGEGVQKSLPEVGDISIQGAVNVGGFMEYFVLQNTRLKLVWQMAHVIADGLSQALARRSVKLSVASS